MRNDVLYVVRFEDGKYYGGLLGATDDLTLAKKYNFEWEVSSDMYLSIYLNRKNSFKHETLKVQVNYEVIE